MMLAMHTLIKVIVLLTLVSSFIDTGAAINKFKGTNGTVEAHECSFPFTHKRPFSCFARSYFPTRTIEINSVQNCLLTLHADSENDIIEAINTGTANIVFAIDFPNHSKGECLKSTDMFYHKAWTWVYGGPTGVQPLVKESVDQDLLSLNLLSIKQLKIKVKFVVDRENCTLTLGFHDTNKQITALLHTAIMKNRISNVDKWHNILTRSAYCYLAYRNFSRDLGYTMYLAEHMFSVVYSTLRYYNGFKCCKPLVNSSKHVMDVVCSPVHDITDRIHWIIAIGASMWIFSPLLIYLFPRTMSNAKSLSRKCNRGNYARMEKVEWIAESPFSLRAVYRYFCNIGGSSGLAVRLRRMFFFLIVLPSPFILRIIANHLDKQYFYEIHGAMDTPLGFFGLLLDFKTAVNNWKCFLGGPHIATGACVVIGLILISIPYSLSEILTRYLVQSDDARSSNRELFPLFMSVTQILKFSASDVSENEGFKLLHTTICARIRMMFNYMFWKCCFHMWMNRFRKCHRFINEMRFVNTDGAFGLITRYSCLSACVVLFALSAPVEVFLLILYNGAPIVNFIILFLKRYVQFVCRGLNEMTFELLKKRYIQNSISFLVVISLVFISYVYMSILVIGYTYVCLTVNYTLLAVIVHARVILNYFLLGVIVLIYLWKAVSGVLEDYEIILEMIIEISQIMEMKKASLETAIGRQNHGPIQGAALNGELEYNVDDSHPRINYVKRVGVATAIPKPLFEVVVEKHKCLRNCIIAAASKMIVTSFIAFTVIKIILRFERQNDVDDILRVAAILLTGLVPLVLRVFSSSVAAARRQIHFQEQISQTVARYWQREVDVLLHASSLLAHPEH